MTLDNRPAPGAVNATAIATFPAVDTAVERAVGVAGSYLGGLIAKSAPTGAVLRALAEELNRARTAPRTVAYPELIDPDVYWDRSAWPQAAATVKHARRALIEVADELASPFQATEHGFEAWLTARVHDQIPDRAADPVAVRAAAIDDIVASCQALHRVLERLADCRPSLELLEPVQAEMDAVRRRQAVEDVKRLRDEVAKAHGDLDRHAFKQIWAATFDDRVNRRDAELRAEAPYRHQELLIGAFRQAITAIASDVDAMIVELTAPILGIGERVVRRYDEIVAAVDAGAMNEHHAPDQ